MPTKICIQILVLFFMHFHVNAQIAGNLTESPVSELDAVQLPSGTLLATSMEIVPDIGWGYRVVIHRSIDNGYTWNLMDSFDIEGIYTTIGDPVMALDKDGKPYVLFMSSIDLTLIIHLFLYNSEDDGQSWDLVSQPYQGNQFADTPQLRIDENNIFYISFTEFSAMNITPATTHFIKSEDDGLSWSDPVIFNSSQSDSDVGSYINFSKDKQINLVFNDYQEPYTYFSSSQDEGESWSPLIEFPNTVRFAINKIISHPSQENICVLTHQAHNPSSDIVINFSQNNGADWSSRIFETDASMAEGIMDGDNGDIHVTYNQVKDDEFSLNYRYSTDGGFTFSDPLVLFSDAVGDIDLFVLAVTGESQSMFLGQDNMFHVTFIDWSDQTKAKHLIFEPYDLVLSSTADLDGISEISMFPNPSSDFVEISILAPQKFTKWSIHDLGGELFKTGHFNGSHEKIDVQDLVAGSYLVRCYGAGYIVVKKLIVL